MSSALRGTRIVTSAVRPLTRVQTTSDGSQTSADVAVLPWTYVTPPAAIGSRKVLYVLIERTHGRTQTATVEQSTDGGRIWVLLGSVAVHLGTVLYVRTDGGRTWVRLAIRTGSPILGAGWLPGCRRPLSGDSGPIRVLSRPAL